MSPNACSLLRQAQADVPGLVSPLGGAPDRLIRDAERRLGLSFPPAYREFLVTFGAAEVGSRRIFGIGNDPEAIDGVHVVWHTEQARAARTLPPTCIVLSSWDDLTLEVAEIADAAGAVIDGPVRELLVEGQGELLAPTFSAWVDRTLREVREDQRG